ncbi:MULTISPECIES: PNGase F N-terminal domain-containing protein [unclassified Carboxylicivirga]|uniref:PNGase F N-terminal domain-containing protein n=1 Tax=Carboxylicivirga TaxID=1628153 RepID=UPI003D34D3A7
MKTIYFLLAALLLSSTVYAQTYTKQGTVTYKTLYNGNEREDMPLLHLQYANEVAALWRDAPEVEELIPGYAHETTYLDYSALNMYQVAVFDDGDKYHAAKSFTDLPVPELVADKTREILGYTCKLAKTVINSNTIELWYTTEAGIQGSPQPRVGHVPGLVLSVVRNGNYEQLATDIKKQRKKLKKSLMTDNLGQEVSANALGDIKRSKMIISTRVFDDEQICWGKEKMVVDEPQLDSVYHFAGGTLIVKNVKLPKTPDHYSVFAEIKQYSNGDAYDRTGSVFVIPTGRTTDFWDGLKNGINTLPIYYDVDSLAYQGVVLTDEYEPLVELVRFFTTFGINHFNDRVKIKDIAWEDHSIYKQDVSDLKTYLEGEVLIGAFIGNYDGGGHKITLDIKAYPGSFDWKEESGVQQYRQPLFNTCNVMEMGGQRYGTMFKNDSLTVDFTVPEGVTELKLRYITTGHGGWGGGDEFNPKQNEIFIDGERVYTFTPWRTDCAAYRKYNPVSGNFWNGISSSDLSRSGWCPGTATNPEYVELKDLKPGKHRLKVAIPLGAPAGNSFSAWSISGILIGEYE